MGFLEVFWVFLYVFRGIPGFLEGVPGCSGFFTLFRMFRGVPMFRCSGVPVFRCSGVPGITTCHRTPSLVVLPNGVALVTFYAWIGWSTGFFFDCLFYDFQVCFVVYIFHPKVSHPSTQRWKTPRILRIVSTQKV